MSNFHYIDPRGRRSGPYSEAELKLLAERGLLEATGEIELDGVSARWPVSDVPWLRGSTASDSVDFTPPPPPDLPAPPTSQAEALSRAATDGTTAPNPAMLAAPACSRVVYILLALLLPFIGLFGVHNIVAGYTTRGVVAIVLSMTTIFGIGCFAFPCTCIGVPMWIVLFSLSVIEVFTIKCDAQGRAFG